MGRDCASKRVPLPGSIGPPKPATAANGRVLWVSGKGQKSLGAKGKTNDKPRSRVQPADSFGSYAKATPFESPCAIAWNASDGREAHSEFRHGSRESRFGSSKALTKAMRVRGTAVGS